MADTTTKIDRFFDAVDDYVLKFDRAFNGPRDEDQEGNKESKPARSKVKAAPQAKAKKLVAPPDSAASSAMIRPRFRIDEVTDAITGAVVYVVTDGNTARCEFASRPTAEKILAMLEATP